MICLLGKKVRQLGVCVSTRTLTVPNKSLFIDIYSQNVLMVTLGRLNELSVLRTAGKRCPIITLTGFSTL